MTTENQVNGQAKIAQRKKFILWFLVPYLLYVVVHQYLLARAICGSAGSYDGSHLSALVAFFWPPILFYIAALVVRGKVMWHCSKNMLLGKLPINIHNIGCLLFLLSAVLLVFYTGYRATQQYDLVQTKMNSPEWSEFYDANCGST